ncbi:MAG: dicarboxylate/amino acid:cation symporter [Pseudomonadales bacterium]|nr:dicarboxylate/amino acid:cation symporter [Pseudomonadales bacterium]
MIGVYQKELASQLAPFGEIFLSLIQMCVLPILITSVVSGLGRLLSAGEARHYVGKLILIIFAGLLMASIVGVFVGVLIQPGGTLDQNAQAVIGQQVFSNESTTDSDSAESESMGLLGFIKQIIPTNIIHSISQEQTLSVLFFAICLGIAIGRQKGKNQDTLAFMDSLYDAFISIIEAIMYALPFGLLCLFAAQIASVGTEILTATFKLIAVIYAVALTLLISYSIIIWLRVGGSYFKSILALKDMLVIAMGTASSLAALPSALKGLERGLNRDKNTIDLIVPLGVPLNPPGSVFYFAVATIFLAQLYAVPLGAEQYIIIVLASVLAGMASAGAPGVAAVSMIAIILVPLNLPVSVAVILLIAIDPIVDPILTAVNMHANCATAALVAEEAEGKNTKSAEKGS